MDNDRALQPPQIAINSKHSKTPKSAHSQIEIQYHQMNEGKNFDWKDRLRQLEPYFENEKLCQLCFNFEVDEAISDNNFCSACIEKLHKINEVEHIGYRDDNQAVQNVDYCQ